MRPWYKRWQTWVLIVAVLAVIGAMQDNEPAPSPAVADTPETVVADEPAPEPQHQCSYYNKSPYDMTDDDYDALLDAELDAMAEQDTPEVIGGGDGSITVGGKNNTVEVHHHYPPEPKRKRRKAKVTVTGPVYPIMRHEMVIVPSDGSAPVIFADIAPPRVATVDKEVARAYSAHMLRMAKQYGTPSF
jgi:hypothetical protein